METAPLETVARRPIRRRIVRIALLVGLAAFLGEFVRVTALTNRHTVIPGKIYRSAQPSDGDIRELARDRKIKTILNLRGLCPDFDWYRDESAAAAELGISQEDITLSANALPSPNELRRVVEVLDRCEYPVLIHCRRGADRTGLVSALTLLLYTDATLGEARQQLWPRYGHLNFGRTAAMDKFFDQYERHLEAVGKSHAPAEIREWLTHRYSPGPARSTLTWIDPFPASIPANTPRSFAVRAENRSDVPWELKPGKFAGVHVSFGVFDRDGKDVSSDRTGLRLETVPVGGSTEIAIPLPGLPPGEYKLVVEMHDSTAGGIPFLTNSFVKFGDDSLVAELSVK